ncbi:MAG: hypothetical protein HYZ09_00890 [Candidatus Kerfeldbacteria bacterium]|nr:hypothetical protein [Candidatus Kerfeldbacteria bacterium]
MKRLLPYIKIVVTLAAVVFIALAIARYAREIGDLALQLKVGPLLLGLGLTLIATVPLSFLWTAVVRPGAVADPALNLAYAKANLIRYIPGNVFGMGARVYFATMLGVPKSVAAASLLTEGVLLLGASGALATLHLKAALAAPALVVAPLVVGLLARLLRNRPAVPRPKRAAGLTVGAYSYCLGLGLALAALASAVGLEIPLQTAIGVFGLAWFLGYVSLLTPSGLGVREGTMVVALTPLIGAPAATFLSVASRLAIVIAELLVAFGWWLAVRHQRAVSHQPPTTTP